ncbi:MAG: hypothetical protein U9N57_14150 [Pseudomonadota bacterium]|nr:hypothetical protein [Pseudomonadota bacterium]
MMMNKYSDVQFKISPELKDVILEHPFFKGVANLITEKHDTPDGLFAFHLKDPTISSAKIVGFALSDKEIPYEMGTKNGNQKYEEFLRIQYTKNEDGTTLKCYESHKLDANNIPVYMKDPDDFDFVDNINEIPITELQKEMIAKTHDFISERKMEEDQQQVQAPEKPNKPLNFKPTKQF